MGVDCKGICVIKEIPKKEKVYKLVEAELKEFINRNKKEDIDPENEFYSTKTSSSSKDMLLFHFKFNGEKRAIYLLIPSLIFKDDKDNIVGDKIRWSVGFWDQAVDVVTAVGYALKDIGTNYIDYNDSDDEDYVLMDSEIKKFYIKKHLK